MLDWLQRLAESAIENVVQDIMKLVTLTVRGRDSSLHGLEQERGGFAHHLADYL
jgi:hypothetical protein